MSDAPSRSSLLADRLQHALTLADISARELDRLAGATPGHFAVILDRLRKRPDADVETGTAEAYARVLGVSLDWLISGTGREPRERAVRAAVEAARSSRAAA